MITLKLTRDKTCSETCTVNVMQSTNSTRGLIAQINTVYKVENIFLQIQIIFKMMDNNSVLEVHLFLIPLFFFLQSYNLQQP